jgi:F0F1-type ATP synthase assembly protein I
LKNSTQSKDGFKWAKFGGLASQWAIGLVVLLFLGKFLDKKNFFGLKTPLFIWLLPFIFIIFSLINIVKETGNKKD